MTGTDITILSCVKQHAQLLGTKVGWVRTRMGGRQSHRVSQSFHTDQIMAGRFHYIASRLNGFLSRERKKLWRNDKLVGRSSKIERLLTVV